MENQPKTAQTMFKEPSLLDLMIEESENQGRSKTEKVSKSVRKAARKKYVRMTLSELMLEGSNRTKAMKGGWIELAQRGKPKACAIGAAYWLHETLLHPDDLKLRDRIVVDLDSHKDMGKDFPILMAKESCPIERCRSADEQVGEIVVHLNDKHGWPRDRIAAWLKLVEDKHKKVKRTFQYQVLALPD
jgi:hypothetical protein